VIFHFPIIFSAPRRGSDLEYGVRGTFEVGVLDNNRRQWPGRMRGRGCISLILMFTFSTEVHPPGG